MGGCHKQDKKVQELPEVRHIPGYRNDTADGLSRFYPHSLPEARQCQVIWKCFFQEFDQKVYSRSRLIFRALLPPQKDVNSTKDSTIIFPILSACARFCVGVYLAVEPSALDSNEVKCFAPWV